jgi:hypothetical protein
MDIKKSLICLVKTDMIKLKTERSKPKKKEPAGVLAKKKT